MLPLLPLLINPMCTITFYLAAWLEGPAAGRWAMRGETGALCWVNTRIFGACWCSLEHLLLGTCLSSSSWILPGMVEEEVGKWGCKWENGLDSESLPPLLVSAESRGLLQGRTSLPRLRNHIWLSASSPVSCGMLGFVWRDAGDGKMCVLCALHPVLHPSWEGWARRQLQYHPVHPHIILPYYIVINWTIPLHYFIFEEIYRLSWWLKRQWLKEQCANEWASAQSLFN